MTVEMALSIAKENGFEKYVGLDVGRIQLFEDVRKMCEMNTCGKFGHSWSCPPACGTLQECGERIKQYRSGIIVQSVRPIEDSMDWDGIMDAERIHKDRFMKMRDELMIVMESEKPSPGERKLSSSENEYLLDKSEVPYKSGEEHPRAGEEYSRAGEGHPRAGEEHPRAGEERPKTSERLVSRAVSIGARPLLPLGAGTCTVCKSCSYPNIKCRFPEKRISSMEAYGMLVSQVCVENGLMYNYGQEHIAFTSLFLF